MKLTLLKDKPLLILSIHDALSAKDLKTIVLPTSDEEIRKILTEGRHPQWTIGSVYIQKVITNNLDIRIPKTGVDIFLLNTFCNRFAKLDDNQQYKLYAAIEACESINQPVSIAQLNELTNCLDMLDLWPEVYCIEQLGDEAYKRGYIKGRRTYPNNNEAQCFDDSAYDGLNFYNRHGGYQSEYGYLYAKEPELNMEYGHIPNVTNWNKLEDDRKLKRIGCTNLYAFFKKLVSGERFHFEDDQLLVLKDILKKCNDSPNWSMAFLFKNGLHCEHEVIAHTNSLFHDIWQNSFEEENQDFKVFALENLGCNNWNIYEVDPSRGLSLFATDAETKKRLNDKEYQAEYLNEMHQLYNYTTSPLYEDDYLFRIEHRLENVLEPIPRMNKETPSGLKYTVLDLMMLYEDSRICPEYFKVYLDLQCDTEAFYDDMDQLMEKLKEQDLPFNYTRRYIQDYISLKYGCDIQFYHNYTFII